MIIGVTNTAMRYDGTTAEPDSFTSDRRRAHLARGTMMMMSGGSHGGGATHRASAVTKMIDAAASTHSGRMMGMVLCRRLSVRG